MEETRYFKGTNKNPIVDFTSRRERIEKSKNSKLSIFGIVVGLAPTNVKGILKGMAFINKLA